MCSDIRLICREFYTLNARGCVCNLHIDYLNPMLYNVHLNWIEQVYAKT